MMLSDQLDREGDTWRGAGSARVPRLNSLGIRMSCAPDSTVGAKDDEEG